MLVLALAHQDPLTNIPLGKKKERSICSVEEACIDSANEQMLPFNPLTYWVALEVAHPSPRVSPEPLLSWALLPLQHLLKTKEGAVYTYFYSSIKRWPANKEKKNRAHLVLCAECPQVNRIRWAFSHHVKIRQKKKKKALNVYFDFTLKKQSPSTPT